MRIQYVAPLLRGISRTKRVLFHPLDLRKWFVVAFTAFLAGLADVGFPSLPSLNLKKRSKFDLEQVLYFPQRAWEWLGSNPGWAILIGIGLFLFMVIGLVISWLSSRGKFMFLSNVVHDRSEVVAPWYEYRNEGNSFFLVNLSWGIIFSAIGIAYVFYCFLGLQGLYEGSGDGRVLIVPAVVSGLGLMVLSFIGTFIFILLRDFLVLIMYRDRILALKAIQKILPLFSSHLFQFIGYGIFLFCLGIAIAVGIIIAGCATCCLGFLILAIPYINAVLLLPVLYAVRAFSIEFLEQFGPEFQIFPGPGIHPDSGAQTSTE